MININKKYCKYCSLLVSIVRIHHWIMYNNCLIQNNMMNMYLLYYSLLCIGLCLRYIAQILSSNGKSGLRSCQIGIVRRRNRCRVLRLGNGSGKFGRHPGSSSKNHLNILCMLMYFLRQCKPDIQLYH